MPSFKWPMHYDQSPLLGATPQKRDILMYFKVCHLSPSLMMAY